MITWETYAQLKRWFQNGSSIQIPTRCTCHRDYL